jgi:hypothetical protein
VWSIQSREHWLVWTKQIVCHEISKSPLSIRKKGPVASFSVLSNIAEVVPACHRLSLRCGADLCANLSQAKKTRNGPSRGMKGHHLKMIKFLLNMTIPYNESL